MHVSQDPRLPPTPSSPTLTNPDMILPNNPSSSADFSPSTSKKLRDLPPPLPSEYHHTTSDSTSDEIPQEKGTMFSTFKTGMLRRHGDPVKQPSCSDKDDRVNTPKEEVPLPSSPTLQEEHENKRQIDPPETAAQDGDQAGTRESTYSPPSILDEDESDPHSHAAMTRRAEEILANAKKRLTNMEGNLNRARSTLERRPSSSMSAFLNRGTEPVSLYTLPRKGRSAGGFSPSKHRQANMAMLEENQQGHSRVYSETSVPSTLQTAPNGHSPEDQNRHLHGEDTAGKERSSEPSRNWFWNGLTRNTSLNHATRNYGLQPLNEDGPALESFEKNSQTNESKDDETFDLESTPKTATSESQSPPTTGLTRARSTTQMRDLREQMQDLKGKISTLKQRAKEDNLRRRSLQSLRTPSPFTAAEQWYPGQPVTESGHTSAQDIGLEKGPKGSDVEEPHNEPTPEEPGNVLMATDGDHAKPNDGIDTESPLPKPTSQEEDSNPSSSQDESLTYHRGPSQSPPERQVIVDETTLVDSDGKEDSLYGDQDYHETFAEPIIERHEDRPDAFDYEHFILHSAMGSYSGVGMRRSSSMRKKRNSDSSASSVETTKPMSLMSEVNGHGTNGDESSSSGSHVRKVSVESVSTVNTFATATEGKHSVTSDDDEDDDWTPRQTMAGSWQPEPKKHKVNGVNGSPKARGKKHIALASKAFRNDAKPRGENLSPAQSPDPLLYIRSIARPDSPDRNEPVKSLQIGDRDRELIERLVGSLARVCSDLHKLGADGAVYEARVCRRKLDAARRMLDGEVNGEAF